MKKKYLIYIHITPSMKVYVGQTYMGNALNRWNDGKGYNHNKYFQNAINKYGWDNIKHYILVENVDSENIDELERHYIRKFDSQNLKFGYNLDSGGNVNKTHSEATKRQIAETEKGKIVSKETRKKLSESHKGLHSGIGIPKSEECKKKISNTLTGKYTGEDCARSIKVLMIDKNTDEVLMEFSNAKEAAKYFGKPGVYGHIRECCRGLRKYCLGYKWKNKI